MLRIIVEQLLLTHWV